VLTEYLFLFIWDRLKTLALPQNKKSFLDALKGHLTERVKTLIIWTQM